MHKSLNKIFNSVSNLGFGFGKTQVRNTIKNFFLNFNYILVIFYYPKSRFFQPPNPDILKILKLLLHSHISNSDKAISCRVACVTAKLAHLNFQR